MDGPSRRPAEPGRSAGMPSLSEAPSGGAKRFLVTFLGVCKKVTRCKSGTISRRYLNNGYAPSNHYRASTMAKYPNTVSKMPDTAYATGKPIQGTLLSISLAASRAGPEWLRAPATPPMRIAGLILNT